MNKSKDTIREIQQIIELVKKSRIKEFSLETEGFKISFKFEGNKLIPVERSEKSENSNKSSNKEAAGSSTHFIVRSPLVGVFYSSPSPGAPPFVEVGYTIEPNQTLCIVEAMKVMNEISSDQAGRIVKIFPENGEMVEFDSPLFELEKIDEKD